MKNFIICVDFDGTIAETNYPDIISELNNSVYYMKELQKLGHTIIIWTCRSGTSLKLAIDWLKLKDFKPDYVNNQEINIVDKHGDVRKLFCDFYLDDRSFPSFTPDQWPVFYKYIKSLSL